MKNLIQSISILIMIMLLVGCSGKSMKPNIKSKLTSISIDNHVNMPKEVFFMTKGDALSLGLGGIIGGIVSASNLTKEQQLSKYLKDNHIDFGEIIRNEFRLALRNKPYYYNKLTNGKSNERFKITVNMYGLVYHHNAFSSDYKPTANIKFELLNNYGKVLWSDVDFITSYSDKTPRMPLDKYFNNPNNLRKALVDTARTLASLVVKRLP